MCLAVPVCRFVCAGGHDDLSRAFGCRSAGKGTPFRNPREHAAPGNGQGGDGTARRSGLVGSGEAVLRCDGAGLRRYRRVENRFRPQPRRQTYGCQLRWGDSHGRTERVVLFFNMLYGEFSEL